MTIRRRGRRSTHNRERHKRRVRGISLAACLGLVGGTLLLEAFRTGGDTLTGAPLSWQQMIGRPASPPPVMTGLAALPALNGRPQLSPSPRNPEIWNCEVVVVGGTLGGVAAAAHAMQAGVQTCLIELTPWLGGQISSQGVSAIDESRAMRWRQNFSDSWQQFKRRIRSQPISLPAWTNMGDRQWTYETNSCWVGSLCFLPQVGATAAQQLLEASAVQAPSSRWETSTAFKGATFDATGRNITAIYGVKRVPKDPLYVPIGRPSDELPEWYAWSSNETFDKIPIRLQAPPNKRLLVIDATDTGELIAWAKVPYRIGSDARSLLGEESAPSKSNPACTQAFTFPFVMAIANDNGASLQALRPLKGGIPRSELRRSYELEGFPMFHNRGMFNYRRIVSRVAGEAAVSQSSPGEMTLVNWNRGNDWNIMDDPLIMDEGRLAQTGQYQNWMGGVSLQALRNAEYNALFFAEWLMETQATPTFPLAFLAGAQAPLKTQSGLSMMPYIREGRRIIGRTAYGQREFMLREADLRVDMEGGRTFAPSAVGLAHYDIDIHGCRYRNWQKSYEASRASVNERLVRPLQIPLEAIVPAGIDNLLIGGKSIAASHIVNAMTRVHYGEWSVGAAAGATAAWLIQDAHPSDLMPAQILVTDQMVNLQAYLEGQGLRLTW